jgi:DNA gyrase/topoisomerase IV subunit B
VDIEHIRATYPLRPTDVVSELLALSVVEHSYSPSTSITLELHQFVNGRSGGVLIDTGRGMSLTPDPGDTLSHAQRALTSIYPIEPASPDVQAILIELVWGARGSLGPALANGACPEYEFNSRRGGEEWKQRYSFGRPVGPAEKVGTTDKNGTTVRFTTSGTIDHSAVSALVEKLRIRISDLRIEGPLLEPFALAKCD